MKLNLGCGTHIMDGYVNVDGEERPGVLQMDIMNLRDWMGEQQADEILMVHVLEHLYYWEADDLLRQCHDALKPGGVLIIECPNILQAARTLINKPDAATKPTSRAMHMLYGDPKHRRPGMCHRWGYTPDSLERLLFQVGFQGVTEETAHFHAGPPQDFRLVACKEENYG